MEQKKPNIVAADTLRRVLTPPHYPDDPNKTLVARSLFFISLASATLVLAILVLMVVLAKVNLGIVAIASTSLILNILIVRTLHQGKLRLAAWRFVVFSWFVIAAFVLVSGNIYSIAIDLYVPLIGMAFLFLGWRGALTFSGATLVYLGILAVAPWLGVTIPTVFPLGSLEQGLVLLFTIVLTVIPLVAIQHALMKALMVATEQLRVRQLTETSLRESEERYRLISSMTSDYTFSSRLDANDQLQQMLVTGAFETITGYTIAEYMAMGGWRALLDPDDYAQDDRDMATLHRNQPVETEVRIRHKNGQSIWVRVYAQPIWDGRLIGINGAVQDITERKAAEQAFSDSDALRRKMFELTQTAVVIFGSDATVRAANPAALRGLGRAESEDVSSQSGITLGLIESVDELQAHFVNLRAQGGRVDNRERLRRLPDGTEQTILYSSAMFEIKGEPHLLTMTTDITERKRTENEILSLNEELLQRTTYLKILNDIAKSATTITDLKTLLEQVFEQIRLIIPMDVFFVTLYDPATNLMSYPILFDNGRYWDQPADLMNNRDYLARMLANRQPILENLTAAELAANGQRMDLLGAPTQDAASLIYVPLILADQIIGGISVQSYSFDTYEQKHLDILMGAAYEIASAIHNARLYESLRLELNQREDAEKALEHHRVRLRALLDANTDIAFLMAPDGKLLTVNRTLAQLSGTPIKEMIGQNAFDLFEPEKRGERMHQFEIASTTRQPVRWEDTLLGGAWDNNIFPVLAPNGEVEAFAVYSRNITEEKRLQSELQRHAAQLEATVEQRTIQLLRAMEQIENIVEHSRSALALIQINGDVHISNPAFYTLFGHSDADGLERILETATDEEQSLAMGGAVLRAFFNQQAQRLEAQIMTPDGSTRDIDLAFTPMELTDDPDQPGILVSANDITYLKDIERFKAAFVADALHDLATPITGLVTRLYMLNAAPEKASDHIRAMENQVDHLRRLLEDLRTISQLDRNQLQLSLAPCDFNQLVRRVFDIYEPIAISKEQALHLSADPLPPVSLDSRLIERVLVNLVANAVNYTPNGKTITIQTAHAQEGIRFAVADEGMGIDKQDQTHIFERFYRTNQARKALATGTGLGLAIVKDIVELHGGHISVSSSPGQGSTFTFTLPAN